MENVILNNNQCSTPEILPVDMTDESSEACSVNNTQLAKTERVVQRFFPGNLPRELTDNFFRDLTWAFIAVLNTDLAWHTMPDIHPQDTVNQIITNSSFVGPLGAQWVYGSLPMVLIAIIDVVYHQCQGRPLNPTTIAKIWAPVIAASLAIPMWNLGQTIGTHVGTTSNLSPIATGVIAAPFVGVFEGFTQWVVKYLFDVMSKPANRDMWRKDLCQMTKLLINELFLNISIGGIPGAVWQIVYFFSLPAPSTTPNVVNRAVPTALLVAFAVMFANFVSAHLINKVKSEPEPALANDLDTTLLEPCGEPEV